MNIQGNARVYVILIIVLFSTLPVKSQFKLSNQQVGPQPDGSILVPSNQLLRPAGFQVQLPGRPVDLSLTPDEKILVVKNRSSIDLIRLSDRAVLQTLPFPKSGASFTGLCLSVDGRKIYVTDAENCIQTAFSDAQGIFRWGSSVKLPKPSIGGHPVPGGLALSKNEDKIYVTLSRNNTLAVITLANTSILEIPVGIAPYEVVLLSAEKAYVSNWGGRRPVEGEPVYNTSGSQVLVDPRTGIASNGSVSVLDLKQNKRIKDIDVGLQAGTGHVLSDEMWRRTKDWFRRHLGWSDSRPVPRLAMA